MLQTAKKQHRPNTRQELQQIQEQQQASSPPKTEHRLNILLTFIDIHNIFMSKMSILCYLVLSNINKYSVFQVRFTCPFCTTVLIPTILLYFNTY